MPADRPTALYLLAQEWGNRVYGPDEQAELIRQVDFAGPPQTAASIRENLPLLQDVEVIFAGWGTAVMDVDFLAAAPRLRAVFHAGGTVRYFVTPEFWARGIVLASAYAINALPVAEYTLAAILFSLRHGWRYARTVRELETYPADRSMPGSYGATVGLVSLGAVARLVRERLRPFDLRVMAFDPFATPGEAAALGLKLCNLDDVFREADVVSLHTPLLEQTRGMIQGRHLAAMKAGATFINTARGAVVREEEMIAVLRQRPDLQAVLDVTWPEPPVRGSPLYRLPNVVLTPHIAGTGAAEASRLGRAMVDEFLRWRREKPLLHRILPEQAERLA